MSQVLSGLNIDLQSIWLMASGLIGLTKISLLEFQYSSRIYFEFPFYNITQAVFTQ